MMRTIARPARIRFMARAHQIAAGAALVAAVSCGGGSHDSPTAPGKTPAGSYQLNTANGKALPATVYQQGTSRFDITAGTLNLNTDQTFSISLSFNAVSDGSSSTLTPTDVGTWTQTGTAISLRSNDGTVTTASQSGNTITFIENVDPIGQLALVYTR